EFQEVLRLKPDFSSAQDMLFKAQTLVQQREGNNKGGEHFKKFIDTNALRTNCGVITDQPQYFIVREKGESQCQCPRLALPPRWQRGYKPDSVLEFVVGASSAKALCERPGYRGPGEGADGFRRISQPHSPNGMIEFLRNIQPVSHQTMMGNF